METQQNVELDPNDKRAWCNNDSDEREFVDRFGEALLLDLNPHKGQDRFAPDLYSRRYGWYADVKIQRTPFRTSDRYKIPSDHCVTLNVNDALRYAVNFGKQFIIYFWLDHPGNAHNGIYMISTARLYDDIRLKRRAIHEYQTRTNDGSGNKTHSYVLDVRAMRRAI